MLLLWGGVQVAIARGLFRRERWAYYVTAGFAVLGLLVAIGNAAGGSLAMRAISQALQGANALPALATLLAALTGVIVVGALGLQTLYAVLVGLSFRDFFGPKVRLLPELEAADHKVHYNNGVAYKNRGMWYMASQEWEAAVKKAPRDLNYLHALGLAYAQLKRFELARATLETALQIAPGNPQISESRALVEQMAAQAG